MNVYIVYLSGNGDVDIKVVDKETYDWINNNEKGLPPGKKNPSGWKDSLVPQSQLVLMKEQDGNDFEHPIVTSGSYQNDRALYAVSTRGYTTYSNLKKAMDGITEKGDVLIETYSGLIY